MNTYKLALSKEYLLELVEGEDSAYKLEKEEVLSEDEYYIENFINLEG